MGHAGAVLPSTGILQVSVSSLLWLDEGSISERESISRFERRMYGLTGFVMILKPNTRFLLITPINRSVQCGHTPSIIIYKLLRLNL